MHEAADRLLEAAAENELTVSQSVQFETYAYLGASLYALGQAAEAVKAFETAFQFTITPLPPPELTLNLVHAYLAAGRRKSAQEALSFLLDYAPGHVAGRMLLLRLENTPAEEQITGAILGASIDSVKKYIHTLSFTPLSVGGYDPAQVWEALAHLERYLEILDKSSQQDQMTLAMYESEIERYKQMEDALVQNMVQMQQDAQNKPAVAEGQELTPLELLFQKKP